ncbi:MAG TPA: hypothetical protein VKS60_07650 [Stellaceae bacterium]|nr:hypothetical protein [Stellaceae bacterium]
MHRRNIHRQAMAATARLVVQMTPEEKSALDACARRAGVSTAEFVRRRVGDDDIEAYREEIEALLKIIEAAATRILASLDGAVATAEAILAPAGASRPAGS